MNKRAKKILIKLRGPMKNPQDRIISVKFDSF